MLKRKLCGSGRAGGSTATTRRSFLEGSGAVAAGFVFPSNLFASETNQLNFYNWDTYIGETTIADFGASSGVKVRLDLFADNDEMFAKLRGGNPGYDVIVPTNDFVARMISANMLSPLDHTKIPNYANIAEKFRSPAYDPGRTYSMPYMWGTAGIGYRKSKIGSAPNSWKLMFESDEYSGRIAWLGEGPSVIQLAMKYLGLPMMATDEDSLARVEKLLIAQKPHVHVIAGDNGQDLLASGEVDLAMEWNGDILQVMAEDPDIAYAVPDEGTILWEDCLCVPAGAPHPENAHRFINYLLDGAAGAKIADFIQYATPNETARALMSADYNNNQAIFPSPETIANSDAVTFVGIEAARRYDALWTRVLAT